MNDLYRYKWMSLKDVLRSVYAMDQEDVSEVARGIKDSNQTKEGFIEAYIETNGNIDQMSKRKTGRRRKGKEEETWAERRNQFVARHLKQMRNADTYSDGWNPNGEPTRRHLGLIAWAYTPSPKRTSKWLKTQPKKWNDYVSNPSNNIKSAIHLIDSNGVNEKIGYVTFSDYQDGLKIDIDVVGLPDGKHGFHVHEFGNLEPKMKNGKWVAGLSAGQHFDPLNAGFHGHPEGDGHLGDLPFITVKNGRSKQTVYQSRLHLNLIKDRAIIIHELGDNYSDYPLPNGGGKSRIAGGIITNHCVYCKVKKNPFDAKSLERILYQSYKRGTGAWNTGHRKFQTPQSWGNARVNSFLVGGKTFFTADNDLARQLPEDLYNAILKNRVKQPVPQIERKIIRDKYGYKIPQKYLEGYKGKQKEKRIKEIEKRRKEHRELVEKYGSDSKIPQREKDVLYRSWDTDKGTSNKRSVYTEEAHKRGFTGSRMNKAKKALEYYLNPIKNPQSKNPMTLKKQEIIIITSLKDRFDSLSKKVGSINCSSILNYDSLLADTYYKFPDGWMLDDQSKERTIKGWIYKYLTSTLGETGCEIDVSTIFQKLKEMFPDQETFNEYHLIRQALPVDISVHVAQAYVPNTSLFRVYPSFHRSSKTIEDRNQYVDIEFFPTEDDYAFRIYTGSDKGTEVTTYSDTEENLRKALKYIVQLLAPYQPNKPENLASKKITMNQYIDAITPYLFNGSWTLYDALRVKRRDIENELIANKPITKILVKAIKETLWSNLMEVKYEDKIKGNKEPKFKSLPKQVKDIYERKNQNININNKILERITEQGKLDKFFDNLDELIVSDGFAFKSEIAEAFYDHFPYFSKITFTDIKNYEGEKWSIEIFAVAEEGKDHYAWHKFKIDPYYQLYKTEGMPIEVWIVESLGYGLFGNDKDPHKNLGWRNKKFKTAKRLRKEDDVVKYLNKYFAKWRKRVDEILSKS